MVGKRPTCEFSVARRKICVLMTNNLNQSPFAQSIQLTPIDPSEEGVISVIISQLITYAQEQGFTRLRLTGGKTLEVQETTGHIDQLVRSAAAS